MSGQPAAGAGRHPKEPTVNDDDTITLWGVGPTCPGCGGPTHAVTADEDAEKPWWCKSCNVRLTDTGEYGSQARFPADSKPTDQPTATDNKRSEGGYRSDE
jgi:hypothetical protein